MPGSWTGETARIDELVAREERLIGLLQEKRTALITRAVTRGLDPNAPMKDSSVEWLGEIPAHWGVRKLKTMVPDITVGIVVTPAKYYVEQGVPCLRSLNIAQGHISTEDLVFISEESNLIHKKSQIFAGDVVIVRTGRAGVAVVVPPELDKANCIDLLIVRRSGKSLLSILLLCNEFSDGSSAGFARFGWGDPRALQHCYFGKSLGALYSSN